VTHLLDIAAILRGIAVFLAGTLVVFVPASFLLFPRTRSEGFAALSVEVLLIFVPVLAGYVTALRASQRPVFNGTLAGAVGTLLLLAVLMLWLQTYVPTGAFAVLIGSILASVGAAAGGYVRSRRGA